MKEWTASEDGEVIPAMDGTCIVRTWREIDAIGNVKRLTVDAETERITEERRINKIRKVPT